MASKKTTEQAHTNPAKPAPEINKKEKNNMKKNYLETFKTIVITILVTAIIAFVLGIQYQERQTNSIKAEAASIIKTVRVSVNQTPSK